MHQFVGARRDDGPTEPINVIFILRATTQLLVSAAGGKLIVLGFNG